LKGRGLSGEVAKTYGMGYAPEGWRSLAGIFPDYTDPLLVESGLVIEHADEVGADGETKRYDRFRDRIMFPIRNVKGECIGFGGRVLDKGEPKYLNSPETPVFSKGRELYGLFEARTPIRVAGYALVTEGYMDVVALAQLGFANSVATLGTACTPDHVQKLFRFTDAVVFSFDGDGAGRRAARKALDAALPLASDTRSVKFLFLPTEHDPDSFIRENGSEAFAKAVKEAMPLSRFLVEAAGADCDLSAAEGRARMASQARPLWSALPDGALKRQLLGELASGCGLGSQDLLQLWQQAGDGPRRRKPAPVEAHVGEASHLDRPADYYEQPSTQTAYPGEASGYPAGQGGEYASGSGYNSSAGSGAGSGSGEKRYAKSSFDKKGYGGKWRKDPPPPRMLGQRKAGGSRADRAVGLLLTNTQAWQNLSADDHAMLAHLPGTPGAVFTWLEAQMHEHGPQPWAAMREALRGHVHEAFACAQAEQLVSTEDSDDPQAEEIREVMTRLRIEHLKAQENEAIALAAQDPSQLQRYRELQTERKALEHNIGQAPV
jgi:DNA primase